MVRRSSLCRSVISTCSNDRPHFGSDREAQPAERGVLVLASALGRVRPVSTRGRGPVSCRYAANLDKLQSERLDLTKYAVKRGLIGQAA